MLQKAVDKARVDLDVAEKNLAAMQSNDWATIENAWNAFVGAAGRVYSKLQQGAKANEDSKAWFEEVVEVRGGDPLLSYLWAARNILEHTIEEVAVLDPGSTTQIIPTETDLAALHEALKDDPRPYVPLALLEVVPPHVRLRPLRDRQRLVEVPREHLGKSLNGVSTRDAGYAALSYLRGVVDEADKMANGLQAVG